MDALHVITFTHNNIGVDQLGDFHIAEEHQRMRLEPILELGIEELIFLTTCNRVELIIRVHNSLSNEFLKQILETLYPSFHEDKLMNALNSAYVYSHLEAVYHWFRVACSLDSLVIGEREILGQMRNAYELCRKNELNGDFMRILMRKTVETGKLIYTETEIASNPISVVNLAYKKLEAVIKVDHSNILVVGAGKTNTALVKKLQKQGASNFHIYNRTLAKAEVLAQQCGGVAYDLNELGDHIHEFDAILTCTGAENALLTEEIFKLLNPTRKPTVIVDLAVPNDVSEKVRKGYPLEYISVEGLKDIAAENLEKRKAHLSQCEDLIKQQLESFTGTYKTRQVELAMRKVPEQIKEIKRRAIEEVFAKDIDELDNSSKETLEKVMHYMEKKYMSTPMLMAKEILLNEKVR